MADSPSSIGGARKKAEGCGRLKVFLGFAAGVGKTFSMLDEAHRRKRRGADVVIGLVDGRHRPTTEEMKVGLEEIPPKVLKVDGEERLQLDVEAVLKRKPGVVLVDDLASANVPGSGLPSRWQEVRQILDAGINVISTVNVEHLESLNDSIADITGRLVTETLPDRILQEADEVELVDVTPRALINRLERGEIVPTNQVEEARSGFYREGNLNALREIAMREAAGKVDEDLNEYRREKRIEKPWATLDRVMICISPTRSSLRLIRRGWRMGQRMHGEVLAVHVEDGSSKGEKEQAILKEDFALCERLGIATEVLRGSLPQTLIEHAKARNATAIILGHPERTRMKEVFKPSILSDLARALRTVDIIVVATETASEAH